MRVGTAHSGCTQAPRGPKKEVARGQASRGAPRRPAWAATGPRRPSAAPCTATRLAPRHAGMLRRARSQRCGARRRRARADLSTSSTGEPCSYRHCQGNPDPVLRALQRAVQFQRPAHAGARAARPGIVALSRASPRLPGWTCTQQANPTRLQHPRAGAGPARRPRRAPVILMAASLMCCTAQRGPSARTNTYACV